MDSLAAWYSANEKIINFFIAIGTLTGFGVAFYKTVWPKFKSFWDMINFQNVFTSGVPIILLEQECKWIHASAHEKNLTQVGIRCHVTNQTGKDLKFLKAEFCNRQAKVTQMDLILSNGARATFVSTWIQPDETVLLILTLIFEPPLNNSNGNLIGRLVLWDQFNRRHTIIVTCQPYVSSLG
jgi:hypothetical protein